MSRRVIRRSAAAAEAGGAATQAESQSFEHPDVTARQLECLSWVAVGKSSTDIGEILGISSRTVEDHLTKLCGHLGVRTRIQAAVRAQELGWISSPTP